MPANFRRPYLCCINADRSGKGLIFQNYIHFWTAPNGGPDVADAAAVALAFSAASAADIAQEVRTVRVLEERLTIADINTHSVLNG